MEKYFIGKKQLKFFVFMMAVALITAIGVTGCSDEENTSVDSVDHIVAVTGIELSKTQVEIMARTKYQLTYTLSPSNATDRDVIWTSSNTAVATVVYGEITGVAVGTATITATTKDGGKTATCTVTVIPYIANAVTGVSLDYSSLEIPTAKKMQMVARISPANADNQNVTWVSSAPNVVTISAAGLLEAKGPGSATVTVTTEEGKFTAKCDFTVNSDFLIADFEGDEIGTNYPTLTGFAGGSAGKTEVVLEPLDAEAAPTGPYTPETGSGKALLVHGDVLNAEYGLIGTHIGPYIEVRLPAGKTLGDYQTLLIDAYFVSGVGNGGTNAAAAGWSGWGSPYLRIGVIGDDAKYMQTNGFIGNMNAIVVAQFGSWAVYNWARGIEFPLEKLELTAEFKALTTFRLGLGLPSGAIKCYMDNFILK